MKKCKFIKLDGKECAGFAVKDDDYCFFHSEKHKQEHKKAVLMGGNSLKRSYTDNSPITLRSNEDAVYLIEQVINEVRTNKISTKMASVLTMLINLALKAIPLALEDKAIARNVEMFNKGEIEMKQRIEKL